MTISIPGFVQDNDAQFVRWWTESGMWGITVDGYDEGDRPMLRLVDEDGSPSNHTLTEDEARHVVATCGTGADLMRRWDYYASAK